jgi:hypothetical protein
MFLDGCLDRIEARRRRQLFPMYISWSLSSLPHSNLRHIRLLERSNQGTGSSQQPDMLLSGYDKYKTIA